MPSTPAAERASMGRPRKSLTTEARRFHGGKKAWLRRRRSRQNSGQGALSEAGAPRDPPCLDGEPFGTRLLRRADAGEGVLVDVALHVGEVLLHQLLRPVALALGDGGGDLLVEAGI